MQQDPTPFRGDDKLLFGIILGFFLVGFLRGRFTCR